jgi:hypothetical protein
MGLLPAQSICAYAADAFWKFLGHFSDVDIE